MTNGNTWFEDAAAELADPQNQRVWSIIVSLFGDLAQERDARISGGALSRIIEPMGIKPEAIRVALHRLRKDGWIESVRSGRESKHFLSEFGRTQSAQVTPRIYARDLQIPDRWHLLIAEDGPGVHTLDDLMMASDYTALGRTVALGAGPAPRNCEDLAVFEVSAHAAPVWLQNRLCPPDLREACNSLQHSIRTVLEARPANWRPTPLQAATLRTLIVHRWRRVVLRHPELPAVFFPPDWSGTTCRRDVFRFLDTLPRPSLDQINASV